MRRAFEFIYIFIHHNTIESSQRKEQQKATQKTKEKTTTIAQFTQIYITSFQVSH